MSAIERFDAAVIGGGPAGATAAWDLARDGFKTLLVERGGRIKPCGGAIPPRLIEEFGIPASMLVARVNSARMVSPRDLKVDMPINGGFVGMVDRESFDPWLRERAAASGARLTEATFESIERQPSGESRIVCRRRQADGSTRRFTFLAKVVVGADGASSRVARQALPKDPPPKCVAAYHEIVESPGSEASGDFDGARCDVWYQGRLSPDFYGWVFPHGERTSVGVGSACKGFSLRGAVASLREQSGLNRVATVRREGAPIPLKPRSRWDDAAGVVLAGDAAGVVAPASGEGIYYAMTSGRLAAQAAGAYLATGDARSLASARRNFMRAHGKVFWILGMMQRFWYSSDRRRERFVSMCRDPDVQHLTWEAYMHKRLVKARPAAHVRIFVKDMAHLLGLARV